MATPTASSVIALTGTKLAEAVVDDIIADAALIANDCLTAAGKLDTATETAVLKWLAAHLIASLPGNGTLTSRKLGDASKSYATAQLGDGLAGTLYGQQAIALLPCLARVGRAQASLEVI